MNRAQKVAWLFVITISVAVLLAGGAVGILYVKLGMPKAFAGLGFIGICGLAGLAPVLYKKERGKVNFDERDLLIKKKASLAAYTIFWALFVLAAMIPFFVLGPKGMVSVKYLAAMVFGGIATVVLVESIVTLEEYGWRDKGEKS